MYFGIPGGFKVQEPGMQKTVGFPALLIDLRSAVLQRPTRKA